MKCRIALVVMASADSTPSASAWIVAGLLLVVGAWLWMWLRRKIEDRATGLSQIEKARSIERVNSRKPLELRPQGTRNEYGTLTLGLTQKSDYLQPLIVDGAFRTTHCYVVGASGTGKSSLLKQLIEQDLRGGLGLIVLDPHGDLVRDTIPRLGSRKDVWLLDLEDTEHMLTYNPLQLQPGASVEEQAAKLVLAFRRIWFDSWGPRLEEHLRQGLSLLIEQGYTLAEFERLFSDADFRSLLVERTNLDQAKSFFRMRYDRLNAKERVVHTESTLNKVSAFLADPRIGMRLCQQESSFDLSEIIGKGEVLLVNLAKGRLAGNSDLFAAIIMAHIEMCTLSRGADRKLFAVYADEVQNYATGSLETLLTEGRKFGVGLTMAHQSLSQLEERLVSIILGNAQTQIYFRVFREDAELLAKGSADTLGLLSKARLELKEPNLANLLEVWESTFRELLTMPAREALVLIAGVTGEPIHMRTMSLEGVGKKDFVYDPAYWDEQELQVLAIARAAELEQMLTVSRKMTKSKQPKAITDLEFLD